MRREVKTFAHAMEYKLGLNDHKGGWENLDNEELFYRLREEVDELQEAIKEGNYINILLEAADVANYALMIAWNAMKGELK